MLSQVRARVRQWTGSGHQEGLRDLPQDWSDALGAEELEYLYTESRLRLRETIEFGDQQEAKALALIRLALILIAASGIFGDLRIESAWSAISITSALAILSSVLVGGVTFLLLRPQSWETGADVEWLAHWAGADTPAMKTAVLETLVEGFRKNTAIIRERSRRLGWLLWLVAFQTACVVSVQVASALVSQCPS